MSTLDLLGQTRIASPCQAAWNDMVGDERARFCSQCQKHVYNIAAMTSAEVSELVARSEGQFCARLYRRRDGTVLTADCPIAAEAAGRSRGRRLVAYALLGLGGLLLGGGYRAAARAALNQAHNAANEAQCLTARDWIDDVLVALGLRQAPVPPIMGFIELGPTPSAVLPSAGPPVQQ